VSGVRESGAPPRVALVTGANRGIGLAIARGLAERGLRVLVGARDERSGIAAAAALAAEGHAVEWVPLEITSEADRTSLARHVARNPGRLDVLVNNAAIYPDDGVAGLDLDLATAREALEVNTLGPLRLCQLFVPLMGRGGYGRIVNLTSSMGQVSSMSAGTLAYRMSKAALHAVTRVIADETRGSGILVNAVCPGWVRTAMGGPGAPRSVEQGAADPIMLATLPEDGRTGALWKDGRVIEW
jgi:NAD(P)-dependent dehydrogenase (short-subunit alcohol dehydrogenase family)